MATIHSRKIGSGDVAHGSVSYFTWNNPPFGAVLSYVAYPAPATPSGPHGTSSGAVEVTSVVFHWTKDNYNSDKKKAVITVSNRGDSATGYDLYQYWIE